MPYVVKSEAFVECSGHAGIVYTHGLVATVLLIFSVPVLGSSVPVLEESVYGGQRSFAPSHGVLCHTMVSLCQAHQPLPHLLSP